MPHPVERLYYEQLLASLIRVMRDADRAGETFPAVTHTEQVYQRARAWCEKVRPDLAHRLGLQMVVHLVFASDPATAMKYDEQVFGVVE